MFGSALCRMLKEARAAKKWSARDVARATNLSPDNIYAIERGDVLSPGIYTVHLLAQEYGVDLTKMTTDAMNVLDASRRDADDAV